MFYWLTQENERQENHLARQGDIFNLYDIFSQFLLKVTCSIMNTCSKRISKKCSWPLHPTFPGTHLRHDKITKAFSQLTKAGCYPRCSTGTGRVAGNQFVTISSCKRTKCRELWIIPIGASGYSYSYNLRIPVSQHIFISMKNWYMLLKSHCF